MNIGRKDKEIFALSLVTAAGVGQSYSVFFPPRYAIARWATQPDLDANIAALRGSYVPSLLFGLGVSAVISYVAKSPLPVLFATATALGMLAVAEQALPAEKRLGPLKYLSLSGSRSNVETLKRSNVPTVAGMGL